MKELYCVAGITKQALWKHRKHQELTVFQTAQVIKTIEKKRKNHKRMGVRNLFYMVKKNRQLDVISLSELDCQTVLE